MSLSFPPQIAVIVALVAGTGCGRHYVARGADLYSDGYYVDAAEVFERTEARLDLAAVDDRARYGLYRGANFLALGDSQSAERWLRYCETQLEAENGALSSDERVLLQRSLHRLAVKRPSPVPPPEATALATTRVVPPGASADAVTPVVVP